MRRRKSNRPSNLSGRVRVITVVEMEGLRDRLARAQKCGPAFQAAAITSMVEYKGAYYQTPHGLRRVFSKEQEVALFAPANMNLLSQKLITRDPMKRPAWANELLKGGARGGGTDAAGEPKADTVRNQ